MPKKIDPKVKERCVRQALEHQAEYSSLTAAAAIVAPPGGVGQGDRAPLGRAGPDRRRPTAGGDQ